MPTIKLIADSGSTKTEWCLIQGRKRTTVLSQGMSPYFVSGPQMEKILHGEVLPALGRRRPDEVFFYGTGCGSAGNLKTVKTALKHVFPHASLQVGTDIAGAARALCGKEKGIACILGTGSSACYFNGHRIVKNNPGLGYILGDEGSGAYMGKKVIQYYLYNTFDGDLRARFDARFVTNATEILDNVYRKPLANRYLASFAIFLAENRGHFMVENIIEDAFNDFFYHHLCKFTESWKMPIHFTGSVAYGFRDVLAEMCDSYQFQLGNVYQKPMDGLVRFHSN